MTHIYQSSHRNCSADTTSKSEESEVSLGPPSVTPLMPPTRGSSALHCRPSRRCRRGEVNAGTREEQRNTERRRGGESFLHYVFTLVFAAELLLSESKGESLRWIIIILFPILSIFTLKWFHTSLCLCINHPTCALTFLVILQQNILAAFEFSTLYPLREEAGHQAPSSTNFVVKRSFTRQDFFCTTVSDVMFVWLELKSDSDIVIWMFKEVF